MPLNVVSRLKWDPHGRWTVSRNNSPMSGPATYVFFITTHTQPCHTSEECMSLIRKLRVLHSDVQSLHDIRYNFMIGDDGNVYEGRGWTTAPMMPLKFASYRNFSFLIGFIGPYSELDIPVEMANNAAELVRFGVEQGLIDKKFQYKSLVISTITAQRL